MAGKERKSNDAVFWVAFIVLMSCGLWFVGLPMLYFKLAENGGKKTVSAGQSGGQAAAQEAAQGTPAGGQKRKGKAKKAAPTMKSSSAKWLKIGGIFAALFGGVMLFPNMEQLFYLSGVGPNLLWEMLQGLGWMAAGGLMFTSGMRMDKQMLRCQKYMALLGDEEFMPIGQLARKLGYSERTVRRDFMQMIDRGFFGGKAYLNAETGCFCRTPAADQQKVRQEPSPAPETEAETGYSGILRNIHRANERIADAALSAKIDRLEEIAAKIFRAVEENPSKRSRIDTFLNYYLPTTQKLLDAYAEFESAGVEGENLRQAKSQIETTMDAIVAGFVHQLDALYQADVLDVDSDIRVMETMLHRDTASVEADFGLGGTAVQKKE